VEALSRLVEIIFVDFVVGAQALAIIVFACLWLSNGAYHDIGHLLETLRHSLKVLPDNTPLLILFTAFVYSFGATVVRIYDMLGAGLWKRLRKLRIYHRQLQDFEVTALKVSSPRFRVLFREKSAGEYLNYTRTLNRVTVGLLFNSCLATVVLLVIWIADHISWRWPLLFIGFSAVGLFGFAISSAAQERRFHQAEQLEPAPGGPRGDDLSRDY
jgi:hypothetical protein